MSEDLSALTKQICQTMKQDQPNFISFLALVLLVTGFIFVSPALAGMTHWDHFVVKKGYHLVLSLTCFDIFQPKLGHRCNMETLICLGGQKSYIKAKGHLRSSW